MNIQKNMVLVGSGSLIIGLFIGYIITFSMANGSNYSHQTPYVESNSAMNMKNSMHAMNNSLQGKTGDALDLQFLNEMIVHHQGAIQMAQTELAGTKRPELIKLAQDIITAQTTEVKMMSDWRRAWFNQ